MEEGKKVILLQELKKITGTDLTEDQNVYDLGIDSFSIVEIINTLQLFCREYNFSINLDALTTEQKLTFNHILKHISDSNI